MVTVQRWAYQGKIPCKLKKDGYVFKRSEIEEWAKAHDFSLAGEPGLETAPAAPKEKIFSLRKAVERGGVVHSVPGTDIYSVLKHAVDSVILPEGADRELVFNELINREEIASTGIGKGVAIPHPRCTLNLQLEAPVIPVVFLKQPVDFNAVDGLPVFVLFLIFSPDTRVHLKLLSRLSLCLRGKSFLELLKQRPGEGELLEGIGRAEEELDGTPQP
jgi:PTS system nitrogen regulatory IIA component